MLMFTQLPLENQYAYDPLVDLYFILWKKEAEGGAVQPPRLEGETQTVCHHWGRVT